jgi:hypothetical protein
MNGECNDFDRPFIDAWKASGIFVVFPPETPGPGRAVGEKPGAALRASSPAMRRRSPSPRSRRTATRTALSSRGTSRCGEPGFSDSRQRREPGWPRASAAARRSYRARSRNLVSPPGLVGGAAALLLQAAPETDPDTLERILGPEHRDIAPPGRDDVTGAGAIDLESALALLRADRGP